MRRLFFLIPFTLSFLLPPPSLLSTNLTVASNASVYSAANVLTYKGTKCLPQIYGFSPNLQSCLNALGKMPRTTSANEYGTRSMHRGQHDSKIPVPIRYQSDDGLCAIDLRPKIRDRTISDVARSIDIVEAAEEIIGRCLKRQGDRSGGMTWGFSTSS